VVGAPKAMTGHLIHIGYAKTGTNFLRRWFALHPQLGYADGGIAGFHSVYSMVREGASQRRHLLYRVTSSEGLATPRATSGEDYVDNDDLDLNWMPSAQTETCQMLASLFPSAHVLVVTRGFRSMILSGYSQYVRTGGNQSLASLVANPGSGDAGGGKQWNYDFLIGLYRGAFGEDRVIALPYELLRDDPVAFFRVITKRLGLVDIEVPVERPNPSLSGIELAWYPRLARRIQLLPLGVKGRRKAQQLFLRASMTNQLHGLIRFLQQLRPMAPVTGALLPPALVNSYRNFATTLRDDPLYRPYAKDYLFDEAGV
jgi:hypothetical protein